MYSTHLKIPSDLDLQATLNTRAIPNFTLSTLCIQLGVLQVLQPSGLNFQPSSPISWW